LLDVRRAKPGDPQFDRIAKTAFHSQPGSKIEGGTGTRAQGKKPSCTGVPDSEKIL
jgi:hypothetical protein